MCQHRDAFRQSFGEKIEAEARARLPLDIESKTLGGWMPERVCLPSSMQNAGRCRSYPKGTFPAPVVNSIGRWPSALQPTATLALIDLLEETPQEQYRHSTRPASVPKLRLPALRPMPDKNQYSRAIDREVLARFNKGMTHCTSCNGILRNSERVCYSCAEPVARRSESSNGMPFFIALVLILSLGLTAYYFPSLRSSLGVTILYH